MTDLLRIDIDGGKYTLIQEASGKTLLHRYGEPWLEDLHGAKVFLSLGYELEELRKLKARVENVTKFDGRVNEKQITVDGEHYCQVMGMLLDGADYAEPKEHSL